ncbi:MAG: hypothetical protein N3B15_00625 [Planctomycetota bacterium]|nr:hypothetical protein [Planctomycetota bacterium]
MQKLSAVVGPSVGLREEALRKHLAAWRGEVKRVAEPTDLQRVLADIDAPSLFGAPSLWVIRASEAWQRSHAAVLLPLTEQALVLGGIVLSSATLEPRLAAAMRATGAVIDASPPWSALRPWESASAIRLWIADRLTQHAPGLQQGLHCAELIHAHIGDDADALSMAIAQVTTYAGDQPVTPSVVDAVLTGMAGRPAYEFAAAVLAGDSGRACSLLHASRLEPTHALAVLQQEVRKLLACLETTDEAQALALAGLKSRTSLRQARQLAQGIGRDRLLRLLAGIFHAQRTLRSSAGDTMLTVELLVLHARRVLHAGRTSLPRSSSVS